MKPTTIIDKKAQEAQAQLEKDHAKINTMTAKIVEQYGKIFDQYGMHDYYVAFHVVLGCAYSMLEKINGVYVGVPKETRNYCIDEFCKKLESLKLPLIETAQ